MYAIVPCHCHRNKINTEKAANHPLNTVTTDNLPVVQEEFLSTCRQRRICYLPVVQEEFFLSTCRQRRICYLPVVKEEFVKGQSASGLVLQGFSVLVGSRVVHKHVDVLGCNTINLLYNEGRRTAQM
jgi:hypothetical protein